MAVYKVIQDIEAAALNLATADSQVLDSDHQVLDCRVQFARHLFQLSTQIQLY